MIMCVLLCYPVSIRIYYQQGVLFLVILYDYMKLSILVTEMLCSIYTKFTKVTSNVVHPMYNTFSSLSMSITLVYVN